MLKANYESQKKQVDLKSIGSTFYSSLPEFQVILDTAVGIIKSLVLGRHQLPRPPPSNLTASAKMENVKKELKDKMIRDSKINTFTLSNSILNDIIIKNLTANLYAGLINSSDPLTATYTG